MSELIKSLAVAVITCNRPAGLEKLLSALKQQKFPHFPAMQLTIVVVENGRKLEAEGQVERYRDQGLDVVYAHEPTPGISYARNCAMDLAIQRGNYFAFIDDDEYPEPNWLDALLWCSQEFEAPVVHGPVISVFPAGVPLWAEAGGFFLRERYASGTEVEYCACNNVLIRSDVIRQAGVRFDAHFALTGGEDTLFFLQLCEKTGVKIVWCDEAVVMEDIPQERVSVAWIVRRATREGANMPHFDATLGRGRIFRLRWILHGMAHFLIALLKSGFSLFQGDVARIRVRREFALGVGMIRGSLGMEVNEYQERHVMP
jgi:glycosyltransferase involved in cell wall biosynthesis